MSGAFPRRGKAWLVDFPDDLKVRPALIVSPDMRNELANSALAVPITSNLRPAPTHLLLPAGQGGLSHNSMARCENVSYIHKSRLGVDRLRARSAKPSCVTLNDACSDHWGSRRSEI